MLLKFVLVYHAFLSVKVNVTLLNNGHRFSVVILPKFRQTLHEGPKPRTLHTLAGSWTAPCIKPQLQESTCGERERLTDIKFNQKCTKTMLWPVNCLQKWKFYSAGFFFEMCTLCMYFCSKVPLISQIMFKMHSLCIIFCPFTPLTSSCLR